MMRLVVQRSRAALARASLPKVMISSSRNSSGHGLSSLHGPKLSDEEHDEKFINFFNRSDIDQWEIRKAMNELAGYDAVPDPKIICAALRACRKLNDFALTVRFLESVKDKCGNKLNQIYPYVAQEIRPTLDELGCNLPEELGYDKPELWLQNPENMQ